MHPARGDEGSSHELFDRFSPSDRTRRPPPSCLCGFLICDRFGGNGLLTVVVEDDVVESSIPLVEVARTLSDRTVARS
jgi:hypothetical protein